MVKCQNKECGNKDELEEDALFCDECGAEITLKTPEELDVPVLCPNLCKDGNRCLNPLQSGKKFCKKCGWKINIIIFQPGSHPCERKTQNGDICLGIVGGESKVCTLCGAGADSTKDPKSTRTSVETCNQQDTNITHRTQKFEELAQKLHNKELIGRQLADKELTGQTDDRGLITEGPSNKELLTKVEAGNELIINAQDDKDLIPRGPGGKDLMRKGHDGKEIIPQVSGDIHPLDASTCLPMQGHVILETKAGAKPEVSLTHEVAAKESLIPAQNNEVLQQSNLAGGGSEQCEMETEEYQQAETQDKWDCQNTTPESHYKNPLDATTCVPLQGQGMLETKVETKPEVSLTHEVTVKEFHIQVQNNEALQQSKLTREGSEQCKMDMEEYQQAETQDKWDCQNTTPESRNKREFQDRKAVQTESIETQRSPLTVFGFDDKSGTDSISEIEKSNGEPDTLVSMGHVLRNDPLFTVSVKQEVDTGKPGVNDEQMDVSGEKSANKNSQILSPNGKREQTEATEPGKGCSQSDESEDSESDSTEGEDVSQTGGKGNIKPGNKRKKQSKSKEKREKKKKKKKTREAKRNAGDRNNIEGASGNNSKRPFTRSQKNTEQEGNANTKNQNVSGSSAASKTRSTTTTQPESKGVEHLRYTKKNEIEVIFHGILSPSLLENVQKVNITYTMEKSVVQKSVDSERIRSHEDDYVEYVTRIFVPRQVAIKREFYYTYHVTTLKQDRSEYVYDVSGVNMDRCISIPDVKVKQEVYHQFDGVVDTKPHTWYNSIPYFGTKGKKKTVTNNAEKAVSIFFVEAAENLEEGNVTSEEFLERVEEIKTGLSGVYFRRARLWNYFQDYENFIRTNIKSLLENMIEKNSCHGGGTAIATALAIVHVYTVYGAYFGENIEMLFQQTKVPLLKKEIVYGQMEDLRRQFPSKLKDVTRSLQIFVNWFASKTTRANWLFSVPLLHFLWGKCKPYERPSDYTGHNDTQPEWWGVVEFEQSQDHFKGKSEWNMTLQDIIEALAPMFAMDYMLPRTLMTVVKFQDCEEAILSHRIPVDVCLASLYYHYVASHKRGSDFEIIQRCLKELVKHMKTEGTSVDGFNEDSLSEFYRIYVIGYDLQLKIMDYYYQNEITVCRAAVIVVQAIALFDNMLKDLDKGSSKEKKPVFKRRHDGIYRECKGKLINLLENSFQLYPQSVCQHSLKLWDVLLSIDLPDGKICSDFIDDLKKKLESMINKKVEYHRDVLIDVYCESLDMYSSHVQDVLSKMAMKAIMEGTSSKVAYQRNKEGRYGRLLSQVFEKQWTTLTDEELFSKALKWSPFQHFLQMFYQKEESKLMSEKCGIQFTKAASILLQKMERLKSGSLCVRDLDLITHNFDIFKKLLTTMMVKEDTSYFDSLLNLRKKELGAFHEALAHVRGFLDLCNFIEVETTDIQYILDDLVILDDKSIDSLCHIGNLSDMKRPEEYNPKVKAFNLEEETLQLLPKLLRNKDSSVFIKKWTDIGNQVARQKQDKLTIKETFDQVWIPVENWWIDLCKKLENGSMQFEEFERKLKNFDEQELKAEFSLMSQGRGTQWIKERLNQIRQYRELQECVAGARAILSVVGAFELKGDFDAITQITDVAEGSDMKMREMDASMMKTCELLRGFRDERTACLDEFVACKPLILWLKESMPSGLKELKVFVDLASISAGEGDMEIAKVQCLHAATTGYAPLIFNLTDDINYEEFLEKCETVWKELQADPKLPKKLHDTNRQLQWLKTVKKAHGSVEVTSLTQAEAINSVGVYKIGKLQEFKENKPTLDEVISLHVSEDEQGTRLRKKYHYGQLHDLQSRLMLVAGKAEKGKDDVDRFTLILDSVVRLGNVYTKLLSAGCVLFSNWNAKLLCDRARRACCFITFGDGEDAHTLKGRKENAQDEVSSMVPRIAKFMENCLSDWLKYIDEKRDKYYHLNYFTIDQMVILQKELVKIGTQDKPSNLIFPLLSAIKKDCSVEDIVEAMKEAQKEMEKMGEENEGIMETSDEEEDKNMDENEEKEFFIKELIQAGYTESLAKKALQHFKTDQVDEAVVWCMDQDDEMEVEADRCTMNALEEMETQTEQFQGWTSNQKSISSVTADILGRLPLVNREVSVDPLIKGLESLWKTFLSSISSSVSDYLSVEHLGLILKRLAMRESFVVKREFLQCFKSGIPNLIIGPQEEEGKREKMKKEEKRSVSQRSNKDNSMVDAKIPLGSLVLFDGGAADLLNTMLTIYMLDYRQPLPQPDEVLICSNHTTLDQLDTFWRRAVFSNSGCIHCLVNGDLLDYDVSDKGDQCLENHMERAKELGIEYRLVVLCSAENEYKSRIVAALDRFRRPNLPVANLQSIRKYLRDQLRVDNIPNKVFPAARVDFDQSTVRVVKSWRAGVGKTLYKKRMESELKRLYSSIGRTSEAVVSIPLHEREIDVDSIMSRLLECTLGPGRMEPRIFHIDVSHEVYIGVDALLFHLLILGCLSNSAGYVWRKAPHDHYIIETMPQLSLDTNSGNKRGELLYIHRCFEILPDIVCRSPEESLNIMRDVKKPPDYSENDRLFDHQEFIGTVFQRPYQYLKHLDENKILNDIDPYRPKGDEINCLQVLLRHCGMRDPSWAELKHFVWFLNTQLQDFEVSAFCSLAAMEDLPGFSKFVLKFLIQMSRDFATRSLNMSEESPVQKLQFLALQDEEEMETAEDNFLQQFKMRRTWESSPHPYIFFNPDHNSMTFLGFNIDRATGNLLDHQTGVVLEKAIMARNLQDSLVRNRVNINENFDVLPRGDKIQKLCSVMGMDMPYDPDPTYELTTDNVKKILAIYMRFKCDIPVIIMGETGCGKTRLVKFMCSLQCPPGVDVQNMILMKVHGGTKSSDIVRKVQEAEKKAKENSDSYGPHLQTVLFFDEANTTEAIGLIKEIMCDKTLKGKPLDLCKSLKIIAACNPYRKHSDELIKRLEQAGLGYHVDSELTVDRLGHIPMRRLVYRVQPLPQSLLPLVWDFGQLDTSVEELYIRQMVLRYINNGKLPRIGNLENVVSRILTVSQDFMRDQKDECSFVSLRDVERVLEVMSWFYAQASGDSCLFDSMDYEEEIDTSDEEDMPEDESVDDQNQDLSDITRSLILALGVCYHACLKKRDEYRQTVAGHFTNPCVLPGGADRMLQEIERCQDVFLDNVQLGKNIAQNQALKENVFMMVTCIELRIPLFLVGKPGSSKSLAKTIVADAMQGHSAHKELFREYKTAQMVSFQCSPLSVPEGIVGTFRQCANFQKDRDLNTFVSVVVLDEVGLAEDSPRMPLKTLHPLLEDGCEGDEKPEPYKKVSFIGISNWALDPAKMNRGILVQREVPELKELMQSAEGICSTDKKVLRRIKPIIKNMAESYLELFQVATKQLREFFGLRDFYSLLKMVYAFADKYNKKPSWKQLEHAILRNFGGMDGIDPVKVFTHKLQSVNICERPSERDPDCSPAGLIQACLSGDGTDSESRYLLLLTENYGALNILQQKILTMHNAITIFGSSFPSDQEYTQVCRNINRIKVCMETGSTVVLLNLENLYESLYDALNQYYVEFGGERYVDLGLGSHRVKCRVHKQFRLIVVAEKQVVYAKFPIPLINRLEKHFLNISTMLNPEQLKLAQKLESWTEDFAKIQAHYMAWGNKKSEFTVSDVFMGYHADMCAAVILHVVQEQNLVAEREDEKILKDAKKLLLWCATPDSVMRLSSTQLRHEEDFINQTYFVEQQHESLLDYLYQRLQKSEASVFAQITTHSKLITTVDLGELSQVLSIPHDNMVLLTLQSFDTEQQFCRQIRSCLENNKVNDKSLLVVQSDCGDQNSSLVACARYCIQDELHQIDRTNVHVVFIIQLPRIAGGCFSGFQCGFWHSLHIDDLRPPEQNTLTVPDMHGKSVGMLIHKSIESDVTMEIEKEPLAEEMNYGLHEHKPTDAEMEVDESDIHVDIISPLARTYHRLPVHNLIFSCIQSALAMVKDSKGQKPRETERVTILLQLLHQSNHMSSTELILGLSRHLDLLLQEKEKNSTNANNWLAAEAARAENINTAGTFRRAWMMCMETKVTPILAGIIAFIDTNCNLDCLSSSPSGSWRQQLWMEVINCPQATGMQYNTQLVSPGRNQEFTEIMVNHTGAENHIFKGDMPFSWLIFRLIEDTVKTTYLTSGEDLRGDADVIAKARDVIMNTPIGRVLQPILAQNVQEATQAYLRDFIHMVYPVQTQEEHQLVCESLYTGTRALVEGHFGDGLAVIVGYHVSYRSSASRLKNFTNLNRVWPECSKCMIEFQSNTPTFFLLTNEEMTLDVLGLHLLLEKLEPEKDILNKEQGRQEWLKKVHLYRPVVERILDLYLPGSNPESVKCGARCCRGIEQARLSWAGVLVVKLFLEHVCSMVGRGKEQLSIKRVMPLWTMMKSGVDMKKIESLEKVEKFLKMCNKTATSQIFEISKDNNACKVCESPFEGPPVTLPCKDVICTKCWNEMKITNEFECLLCHKKIKDDFDPATDRAKNQLYERYFDYKRRCNSFFVEVVSQLCFADGTPPEDKVIEKLMKYITRETKSKKVVTKEMSIFDDGIDPTPVLRSFLLQLVLRTSGKQVYQYLEEYVKQANQFVDVNSAQDPQFIELCLLIIQCIEDSYHQEVSKSDEPEAEAISMAVDMLRSSRFEINNHETLNVHSLYVLAQVRFGLIVAAKYVQEVFVVKSRKTCSLVKVRRLIDAAAQLCQDSWTKWPCIFFIKQLCRCYGLDSYEVVSNSSDPNMCRWMRMLHLQRDEKVECSDNYIVCGQQYAEFRDIITKCLLGEHLDCLVEKLQGMQAHDWKIRTWLLLAIHREVTMSNVYTDEKRESMPKAIEPVTEFLTRNALFNGQELLIQALMGNSIWRHFDKLNVGQGDSLQDQSLGCLLVHALITLLQLPGERTMLQPFKNLLLQPHTMSKAFLPTMPQDDLAEIKEALLQGRGQFNFDENPVLYRCPNGHPYVIGNCGNPAYVGICKECGSQIGGEGYRLQAGNIKDTGEDRTQPGHILGRANTRVVLAQTERKLTPVGCAILRLLTHVIMLLGANENPQAICGMIKPDIPVEDVFDFLLSHILLDISIIQKTTGYSKDDAILLIHSLLNTILNTHNQGEHLGPELCGLMSKDSRNRWEEMFTARYIAPLLQTMDQDLKANNNLVAGDKRLGSDPLLCLLYETETPQEASKHLHDVPAVWRYRKRISMDHLTTEFHNQMKDDNKVLQLFLKEEQQLRAVRLVPSIMRLQKLLIQKYQLRLDRAEANTFISLSDVVSDFEKDGKSDEVKQLIADFGEAWDCVRESLSNFPCPTMDGYATVSKEYCSRQIAIDTNISMILPTQRDEGLCSYVLLYYLLKKQNSFLDKYCKATKQSTNDLPKVKVADVTPAHLICYHPDRDILSIVLANCNYSFEVGHGTTITYDFQNIERQLMDRFFFSKSFIEIDEIEVVTYRSDATNSAVFFSLRAKIAQEQLGAAVRRQICEEFRSSLPDICYSLDNLDITISFLKSVGETPDCQLETFMTNTLKLKNPLFSQKSRQVCQCRHTQSLWITLALEKTKCLARHKRDAFENIKPEFRIEMTEVQIEALNYFCGGLQMDKLDMLIECLFECVMLRLTISQNKEDEDYVDTQTMSLRDFLMAHMESPLYDEDITFPDWIMDALGRLPADPESPNYLQVRHAVAVWFCLYESYMRKEYERR